jgi:hypothetical protein
VKRAEARGLLETTDTTISGAILDVHRTDGEITPIAEYLLERGVPVVVQTGWACRPNCTSGIQLCQCIRNLI